MPTGTIREKYDNMRGSMKTERTSFVSHWQECSEFTSPRRGRFSPSDRNKGDKRYKSIINSVASTSLKKFRAGIMAGAVSNIKPWFKTRVPDDKMMEHQSVKEWFAIVDAKNRRILNEGNFYGMMSQFVGEEGQFGTAFMTHVDDFENVARFYTHTAGSYMISQDGDQNVNTAVREYQKTAQELVSRFGPKNVSRPVNDAYDKSNYNAWFDIVHVIEPNDTYRSGSLFSKDKKFKSCYYEPANLEKEQLLEEKGFDQFPGYVGRWDVTDGDIYATDWPTATALGDIKQLQLEEKRKTQGIERQVMPTLQAPAEARNVSLTGLPGDVIVYDMQQGKDIKPVFQPNINLNDLRADITEVEKRIKEAFYIDVLLGITDMEGVQPQNEFYLTLRNQERLLQLGDPLNRFNGDVLARVVKRIFAQGVRARIYPPPPPELAGQPIVIEFVSTLAMAQQAVNAGPISQMTSFVLGLLQFVPAAADKYDFDEAIDLMADAVGTAPTLVVPDDKVAVIRQQRAQQKQQQDAMMAAQSMANTAKMASDAKTNNQSVLTAMSGALGGGQQ